MTDTPKPKKLTIKQKKFVKAYVANDGNGQEAVKAVYDVANDNVARNIASENLTKPNVKEAIELALIKHEITMDAAVKPIADGLKATKYFEANEDGTATGQPDHSVRLKASSMALKLMGAEKTEDKGGNTFIFSQNANFNSGKYKE